MTEYLPQWLMLRYARLWARFKQEPFAHDKAVQALGSLAGDVRMINVLLSELKKRGWLTSERSREDTRKKVYMLRDIRTVIEELAQEQPRSETDENV